MVMAVVNPAMAYDQKPLGDSASRTDWTQNEDTTSAPPPLSVAFGGIKDCSGSTFSGGTCSTYMSQRSQSDGTPLSPSDLDRPSFSDEEPMVVENLNQTKITPENSPTQQLQDTAEVSSGDSVIARTDTEEVREGVQSSSVPNDYSLGQVGEREVVHEIATALEDLRVAPAVPTESRVITKDVSVSFLAPTSVLEFMADSEAGPVPTSVQIHRAHAPRSASKRLRISEGGHFHRQVSFHKVQIRRYAMVAGDNPSCQMGAPVTLDWGFEELPELDLDDFELTRVKTRRRKMHHLLLNYFQRRRILSGIGYSDEDIKKAENEASRERFKRTITRTFLPISRLEDMSESLRRKVKRRMNKEFKTLEQEVDRSIRCLREKDGTGSIN